MGSLTLFHQHVDLGDRDMPNLTLGGRQMGGCPGLLIMFDDIPQGACIRANADDWLLIYSIQHASAPAKNRLSFSIMKPRFILPGSYPTAQNTLASTFRSQAPSRYLPSPLLRKQAGG